MTREDNVLAMLSTLDKVCQQALGVTDRYVHTSGFWTTSWSNVNGTLGGKPTRYARSRLSHVAGLGRDGKGVETP